MVMEDGGPCTSALADGKGEWGFRTGVRDRAIRKKLAVGVQAGRPHHNRAILVPAAAQGRAPVLGRG